MCKYLKIKMHYHAPETLSVLYFLIKKFSKIEKLSIVALCALDGFLN